MPLLRGYSSSSCRGLVAFCHQMGAFWAPWLAKMKFGVLGTPPSSSFGGFMAFIHLIWDMFVYGFGCFFVLFIIGHPWEVSLKVLWRSDLIWLRYLGSKNVYLFICLFVCFLICLFYYFNHLGIPTRIYPQNFVKIWLDLAEIYRI